MKHIAYLACPKTLPGSPARLDDAFEHDQMMEALIPAFAGANMHLIDLSWDDETADWNRFDAVIIGTAWDYWDRMDEFLAKLDDIHGKSLLFNPPETVRWNIRKTYLRDLEARGAALIPTLWIDEMTDALAAAAFDSLGSDDLVFKRQIGAGAYDQHRLKRGESLPDMPHKMIVQPFLEIIQQEGEVSFIFIDGDFCHALTKRAAPGDYRIQSLYGGTEEALSPDKADLQAAKAIIATLDTAPLYARVDMVRGADGSLLLMELEMIEPYLYPLQGPELGERLAAGLARRLAG